MRIGTVTRNTKETEIVCSVNLDGIGISNISTGVGFFDHMLELLCHHSLIDIDMVVKGDTHVDLHHTVEDAGYVLAQSIIIALGNKEGIRRYGYVGRDVEQIIRDLVEISISQAKIKMGKEVQAHAEKNAEERILDVLVSKTSSPATREAFRQKLRNGELNNNEVEIPVATNSSFSLPTMDIPGMPGSQMGMINLGDVLGKSFSAPKKNKKMTIEESHTYLLQEETDKLLDNDKIIQKAIEEVEQSGIVFIDEIDKITSRSSQGGSGPDVSREGVQRDLLPIVEGSSINTKYGIVKTDHILFVSAGAFHSSKPSDLIPEFQGRFPIRVELDSLTKEDFVQILTEPENALVKQYIALLKAEDVHLTFQEDAIDEIAEMSAQVNLRTENIGARRLQTIMEKFLEDISFDAPDLENKNITIDASYIREKLKDIIQDEDLSRYIL